ncbi:hypothetical protein K450DRAFT_263071 [Umbelopsis ramanniana AG]|uniref:Uncharacterized protein n=1 Tax=Umbelopsis ramanniana AG TaxID=1314678 RepID=A0AAD5E1P2_UMBRA|nr:uncharacterized protein K450DRAFT_263071 [Umbelopsis ramanniana AG]KAI8575154.1 hypothetical protein K450DRAFT_263071 [Umbelopsis ramanniana AG]
MKGTGGRQHYTSVVCILIIPCNSTYQEISPDWKPEGSSHCRTRQLCSNEYVHINL